MKEPERGGGGIGTIAQSQLGSRRRSEPARTCDDEILTVDLALAVTESMLLDEDRVKQSEKMVSTPMTTRDQPER